MLFGEFSTAFSTAKMASWTSGGGSGRIQAFLSAGKNAIFSDFLQKMHKFSDFYCFFMIFYDFLQKSIKIDEN